MHDDAAADYTPTINYDGTDDNMTPVDYHQHNQQMESSSQLFNAGTTASEPGDYYDYGWDYETAVSSGQQTPQTPSYHYQLQQQQQLERQKRRGGRPVRHTHSLLSFYRTDSTECLYTDTYNLIMLTILCR